MSTEDLNIAEGGFEPAGETAPDLQAELTPEQIEEKKQAEEAEHKRKTGSQRAREKAERLERENQALRDALARGERPKEEPTPAPVERDPEEPREDDPRFKTFEDYQRAVREYDRKVAVREVETRLHAERVEQTYASKVAATAAAHPEFMALAAELSEEGIEPSIPMKQVVMASEVGHELLHHLASNPQETQRIAQLPSQIQFLELGVILGQIKGRTAKPTETKSSQAPPPPRPIKGAAGSTTDLSAIKDDNDWYRARKAQKR